MLVRSICLLCWKLVRSQTPGVYTDPFTRICHTRLSGEYPLCCLTLGAAVWQEGPRSACWLPDTHRHSKHTGRVPQQLQQQHGDNAARRHRGHRSHRTPLNKTRVPLWRSNFYLTSITQIQQWQDWTAPSTPTNTAAASPELPGSGPCPQPAAA